MLDHWTLSFSFFQVRKCHDAIFLFNFWFMLSALAYYRKGPRIMTSKFWGMSKKKWWWGTPPVCYEHYEVPATASNYEVPATAWNGKRVRRLIPARGHRRAINPVTKIVSIDSASFGWTRNDTGYLRKRGGEWKARAMLIPPSVRCTYRLFIGGLCFFLFFLIFFLGPRNFDNKSLDGFRGGI